MGATDVLSIVVYILGALLLLVLIALVIKLMFTVDKTNRLLDDIQGKSKSLDGLFKGIDKFTDGMNRVSTTVVSSLVGLFSGLLKKRKSNKDDLLEDDDDFEIDVDLEDDEDE
jgi:hypothetical protein